MGASNELKERSRSVRFKESRQSSGPGENGPVREGECYSEVELGGSNKEGVE